VRDRQPPFTTSGAIQTQCNGFDSRDSGELTVLALGIARTPRQAQGMTTRTRRRTNLRVGAGISTRRSGLAAAEDALGAALAPLDGAIPDLAFLFVAPQFEDELESIVESANASLGGGTLLGCVAGGVIGGAREVEDAPAVSAWAATLPGVRVRPFT